MTLPVPRSEGSVVRHELIDHVHESNDTRWPSAFRCVVFPLAIAVIV